MIKHLAWRSITLDDADASLFVMRLKQDGIEYNIWYSGSINHINYYSRKRRN